jgi:fumarylacetoacetase
VAQFPAGWASEMNFPIDETHDPTRLSWVESANGHPDFPVQNLPFGIFSPPNGGRRAGVAIGDKILDLKAASAAGLLGEASLPP